MQRIANITRTDWLNNEKECMRIIKLHWDEMPLVNISANVNLGEQTLVRFRGMVQNNLSPEYYFDKYEVLDKVKRTPIMRTMKYMDAVVFDVEREDFSTKNPNNKYGHRHVYVGVPIPGLNDWGCGAKQEVRELGESSQTLKRTINNAEKCETHGSHLTKKPCTSQMPVEQTNVSNAQSLGPLDLEKKCFLLIYDETMTLRITDLVEVVGFTSRNEESIVRIHCVALKSINHCNLISYNRLMPERFSYCKRDLHFILTQILFGDKLVAEYLIYHLISRIYARNDVFPIGNFSLNISQVPASVANDFGKGLYEFIKLLVPVTQYLPMSLQKLNTLRFLPQKDYETDTMKTGVLQLPANTYLLVDETKLDQGELTESGTAAMKALNYTMLHQKVPYDCFYPVDLDCDIPFLVISEGKSVLQCPQRLCLQPDQTCLSVYSDTLIAAKSLLERFQDTIRPYLAEARYLHIDFGDGIMEVIQDDFVCLRQTRAFTAEDLHRLLVLSRLIAISDGKTVLDLGSWHKACELDEMRAKRNKFVQQYPF